MVYVVDAVKSLVAKMSSTEPTYFQRDDALYIVTPQAFGQVALGLSTRESHNDEILAEEFNASTNLIIGQTGDKYNPMPVFPTGETERLAPLVFGPDDNSFSLKQVFKSAEALSVLPNDGKIRMVGHGSGYHSHKHGYAADGIDVWLDTARVMDTEQYFALMKKKEDAELTELEMYPAQSYYPFAKAQLRSSEDYVRKSIPDALVMTPLLMVAFPRRGYIDRHGEIPSWTMDTTLPDSGRLAINFQEVSSYKNTPYGVHVTINAQENKANNPGQLSEALKSYAEELQQALSATESVMPEMAAVVERFNGIHQRVCAKNIDFEKDLEKRLDERAEKKRLQDTAQLQLV